jgi:hypothetical protein
MILKKIGFGLAGLLFVLTLAVTESSAQRHGRNCRHDNGRHVGWYNRDYRGGRRYVSSRYYAPRYSRAYYPQRYEYYPRYVRYRSAPRYSTSYYASRYYTEYPRYTSYRRYPRNSVAVSVNFGW